MNELDALRLVKENLDVVLILMCALVVFSWIAFAIGDHYGDDLGTVDMRDRLRHREIDDEARKWLR